MSATIEFETPENVEISYEPAGLGTRFVAWFVDQFMLLLLMFALFVVLAVTGALTESAFRDIAKPIEKLNPADGGDPTTVVMYFVGLAVLVWGFGSFLYFTTCELCLRGQTIGKRMSHLRVVKHDGFALDAPSVLIRNVFRVVDHLPPLWLVPLVSKQSQRLGDMVSGTVVVSDEVQALAGVREKLSERKPVDAQFRFDAGALKKLRPDDVHAIEQLLERWPSIAPDQRHGIVVQIVSSLSRRLGIIVPDDDQRHRFLEDLLAAEYRRQSRQLG